MSIVKLHIQSWRREYTFDTNLFGEIILYCGFSNDVSLYNDSPYFILNYPRQ